MNTIPGRATNDPMINILSSRSINSDSCLEGNTRLAMHEYIIETTSPTKMIIWNTAASLNRMDKIKKIRNSMNSGKKNFLNFIEKLIFLFE